MGGAARRARSGRGAEAREKEKGAQRRRPGPREPLGTRTPGAPGEEGRGAGAWPAPEEARAESPRTWQEGALRAHDEDPRPRQK